MYKAMYLSPMIPSFNVKGTVSFFSDVLNFSTIKDGKEYAILGKDHLSVHILSAGPDIGEMEFYLEVDDIEHLWNNLKHKAGELKFKEPFDREYGMREIHVVIPHTRTLMFLGQAIP